MINTTSLKNKIITMVVFAMIPFIIISILLLIQLRNYTESYDSIVSNITVANSYNLNFKEQIDETLYIMVARDITIDEIGDQEDVTDPYEVINDLRENCNMLLSITTDKESLSWMNQLLHNLDTLEQRVDDISANLVKGGLYDNNIEMLENNIYILTELIQDDIQLYIYYQTRGIDTLKNQLNNKIYQFILIYLILICVVVLILIFSSIIISTGITRPLLNLCRITEQISEGDFSVRAPLESTDEIANLSQSVNQMTERLESMVTTIKDDERRMRYTELRLLQEQINPHFLYNTLDTIVWLIEADKNNQAEDMVVSLSSFFRLVLSHGQEFITIADEEKHIRSYLEIQHVRYKDILDYDIEINPELYPYEILKLTLQPLVENALYHGIKYKRAKGKISVKGDKIDEKIVLIVFDDGVGMDAEELSLLQQEIQKPCQETEKGFGLANVNERLRMNFGPEYGITIDSELGKGTKVTVIIPAILSDKEA